MIRTYISERILVRTYSYRCMDGRTYFKFVHTHIVRTIYVRFIRTIFAYNPVYVYVHIYIYMIRTYISERILVRTYSYRCMDGRTYFKFVHTHIVRTIYVRFVRIYIDIISVYMYVHIVRI
jgi:predicted nucleic acid-binding Zn ribbon protein